MDLIKKSIKQYPEKKERKKMTLGRVKHATPACTQKAYWEGWANLIWRGEERRKEGEEAGRLKRGKNGTLCVPINDQ